jgi:predicted HTH domain antitoxin
MTQERVILNFAGSLLQALNTEPKELASQIRLAAALRFFRNHKLSFGKAAEFAGLSRERFAEALAAEGIPLIDYDPAELARELKLLRA